MSGGELVRYEPPDPRDAEIDALQEQVDQLRRELAEAKRAAREAQRDAGRAVSALRSQLEPLYRALRMVFGELDALGTTEASPVVTDARIAKIWETWKIKMPGYPARVIDALLIQGDLTTTQLAIAVGCKTQRISDAIHKLNRAGLINKNGGRFALKAL